MTMVQFSISEAKAKLSELVEKARLGEEVVITKLNRPVAKIVPISPAVRRPGTGKGHVLYMADDFDSPLEDFVEYE